jgi:hypothetical protein
MPTVADVLKRIERIKKDLEYVRTFQDKWRDQRDRFPKIYEGILEQEKAFLRKIDELRGLKVEQYAADPIGGEEPAAGAPAADDEGGALRPRISPAVAPGDAGHAGLPDPTPRPDSSDEKRAAAAEIGEKLRKRTPAATPDPATAVS